MGNIIWLIIMVPVSMLFTGIGVYAYKREKEANVVLVRKYSKGI